jgi:hypothetical protein
MLGQPAAAARTVEVPDCCIEIVPVQRCIGTAKKVVRAVLERLDFFGVITTDLDARQVTTNFLHAVNQHRARAVRAFAPERSHLLAPILSKAGWLQKLLS